MMTYRTNTVLIAEDDPVLRRVMSFSIARTGLTVESVGDGQAAFERLCRGGIDFLVTDHQMPICSGLELLERLSNLAEFAAPPTVLCTARDFEIDSHQLEDQFKLVAVLQKPFCPSELSKLIFQQLAGESSN